MTDLDERLKEIGDIFNDLHHFTRALELVTRAVVAELTEEQLKRIGERLPEDIKDLADRWS